MIKNSLFLITLLLVQFKIYGQSAAERFEGYHLSTEADEGFSPCLDTLKFFVIKKVVDIGRMLPTWRPVLDFDTIIALEGIVTPRANSKNLDTHVSHEDHPLYHYTHDVSFNIKPDEPYRKLLALQVKFDENDPTKIPDTVLKEYIHAEWESGLGANNKGNPCAELNKQGKSCGFYSAGHERRDMIWNWPTFGDWAHLEGRWTWDRGHPPAGTEIHPICLAALRRNLPAQIINDEGKKVFATEIDIFASGDGGALSNNRTDKPTFVKKTRISQKDYRFEVSGLLPKPSMNAVLKYKIEIQKGDNYIGTLSINTSAAQGDKGDPLVEFEIPWKNLPDTLVFARTVFLYWDEGNGIPNDYSVNSYKVKLESLHFKNRKEFLSRSELRVFLEVAGQWIFLNEFTDKKDVLDKGLGKTMKKKWDIGQEFIIHVPQRKSFRIHAGGWEADGTNRKFGWLMDSYTPCTPENIKKINKLMVIISPHKFRACHDDRIGEIHTMHSFEELNEGGEFEATTTGNRERDFCICNKGYQDDVFRLKYRIERIR